MLFVTEVQRVRASKTLSVFIIIILIIRNIHSSETVLNDVIQVLPAESFVKVFYEEIGSLKIRETLIPITLVQYNPATNYKYNTTFYCKFFHIGRLIGSRTNQIFNILQINNWKIQGPLYFLEGELFNMVPEKEKCNWSGSITSTIIVGNYSNYKLFSENRVSIGVHFTNKHVLVFNLKPSLQLLKVCWIVIGKKALKSVCIQTNTISKEMFDVKVYAKWSSGAEKPLNKNDLTSSEITVQRNFVMNRRWPEIIASELFTKLNKSNDAIELYFFETLLESEYVFVMRTDSMVLVDEMETNFLSCYTTPFLKFEMYVKPFQLELWLCIGLCLTVIAVFIYIYNRQRELSLSFSPFFFFISTIFDEPYSIPTAIWNDKTFKTVTIAWLLTSFIFTNLYTGIMISDLSVPSRGEALNGFEDVFGTYYEAAQSSESSSTVDSLFWRLNYTQSKRIKAHFSDLSCNVNISYSDYDTYHQQFRKSNSFALLQAPTGLCERNVIGISLANERQRLCLPQMYKLFDQFRNDLNNLDTEEKDLNLFYAFNIKEFFSAKHRLYPRDPNFPKSKDSLIKHYMSAAIEKELVACERSIFLAEAKELNVELRYLRENYPDHNFYVGNGTIENGRKRKLVWYFEYESDFKIAYYFRLLLQAGIRAHILKIQHQKEYMGRRIGTQIIKESEKPKIYMDMNGSIQTIFIILVVLLVLAGCVFLFEFIHNRRTEIYAKVVYSGTKIVVGFRGILLYISRMKVNKLANLSLAFVLKMSKTRKGKGFFIPNKL
jgi:hypothetical protein